MKHRDLLVDAEKHSDRANAAEAERKRLQARNFSALPAAGGTAQKPAQPHRESWQFRGALISLSG